MNVSPRVVVDLTSDFESDLESVDSQVLLEEGRTRSNAIDLTSAPETDVPTPGQSPLPYQSSRARDPYSLKRTSPRAVTPPLPRAVTDEDTVVLGEGSPANHLTIESDPFGRLDLGELSQFSNLSDLTEFTRPPVRRRRLGMVDLSQSTETATEVIPVDVTEELTQELTPHSVPGKFARDGYGRIHWL